MKLDTAEGKAARAISVLRSGKRYLVDDELEANGITARFTWRVLTRSEKQVCLSRSIARFKELGIPEELRGCEDLESEVTTQVLFEAMRSADDSDRPFAGNVDELREFLTVDQAAQLWNRYADFEDEVNPNLDESLVVPLIEEAIKKKDLHILMSYGAPMLATYILTLGSPPLT